MWDLTWFLIESTSFTYFWFQAILLLIDMVLQCPWKRGFLLHMTCDPCDYSLGSLDDISLAQIYRADLNSVVFFLLFFVVMYSLNETISLFISVFSDLILFYLFLFLYTTFPVFFFLFFSSICANWKFWDFY